MEKHKGQAEARAIKPSNTAVNTSPAPRFFGAAATGRVNLPRGVEPGFRFFF